MQQQILCRCAINCDLLFFKCTRGHEGLVCGHCLRTGCVTDCPVCLSAFSIEESVPGYMSASPSPAHPDFSGIG
jgi:hypothetical protein